MDAQREVAPNGQIGCVWIFQFLLLSTVVSLPVALISWLVQGSVDFRRVWLGIVIGLFSLFVVVAIASAVVQATIRRPRYMLGWMAFFTCVSVAMSAHLLSVTGPRRPDGSIDGPRTLAGVVSGVFIASVVTLGTVHLVQATIRRPRYMLSWLAFYGGVAILVSALDWGAAGPWRPDGSIDGPRTARGIVTGLAIAFVVTYVAAKAVQATTRRPRYVLGWLAFILVAATTIFIVGWITMSDA